MNNYSLEQDDIMHLDGSVVGPYIINVPKDYASLTALGSTLGFSVEDMGIVDGVMGKEVNIASLYYSSCFCACVVINSDSGLVCRLLNRYGKEFYNEDVVEFIKKKNSLFLK